MEYKITVSRNQLRVIMIGLESYFRTRLGQFRDLSDDIAFNDFEYNRDVDGNEKEFNERIRRRNIAEDIFNDAFNVAKPVYSDKDRYYKASVDMNSAMDIWHVIRHQFWKENPNRNNSTVDACEPSSLTNEELPKIEVFGHE